MMPFSIKIDTALLCLLCVLLTVESMTTSKSRTRAADAAVELSNTTEQPTTTQVTQQLGATWTPAPKFAEVNAASSGEMVSPTGMGVRDSDKVTSRKNSLDPSATGLVTLRISGATSSSQRLFTEAEDSISRSETTRAQLSYKTTVGTHKPSPTSLATAAAASETPPSLPPTPIAHTDAASMVQSTSEGSTEGASFSTQNRTNTTSPGAVTMPSTTHALPIPLFSLTKTSNETSLTSGPPPTIISKTSPSLSGTTGSISTSSSSPSTRWIPQISTKSLPTSSITTSPSVKCKTTTSKSVQSCSTRGIVNKCLIAVGALAVLATIFMVSTIVLCAKLSARKQKVKRPKESTEMMCISSLLPERHHNYRRQRNPVTNGVLVFPGSGDSDEDGGDDLTLHSFLPESV